MWWWSRSRKSAIFLFYSFIGSVLVALQWWKKYCRFFVKQKCTCDWILNKKFIFYELSFSFLGILILGEFVNFLRDFQKLRRISRKIFWNFKQIEFFWRFWKLTKDFSTFRSKILNLKILTKVSNIFRSVFLWNLTI